jgi:hypothetical protein
MSHAHGLVIYQYGGTQRVQEWKKDEDKEEFRVLCARVMSMQQKELINMGLSRKTDASLSKLLLMKHGFSDRQEVDLSSADGTMSPTKIEIVAPNTDE